MNPTIVRHLLKTDWSRLKRYFLCLWLLLALSALPWLLHNPAELLAPTSYDDSVSGDIIFRYTSPSWANDLLKTTGVVSSLLALILAAWIGMLGSAWQGALPVRKREKIAAKTLGLLVFLVLPQTLFIVLTLWLHGFSAGSILNGAAGHTITSSLMLGTAALFGAWCPSLWLCTGAVAATAAGYSFFAMMFPQKLHNLASQFSNSIWAPDGGLPAWAFFGLAIVLLGALLLPGWLRRGSMLRVAVAVAILVFASGIAGRVKPAAPPSIAATSQAIDLSAIRPVIRSAEVQFHEGGLDNEAFTRASVAGAGVTASIVAEGCPPGYNVQWQILPQSELRRAGRTIGKKQPPVPGREPAAGFKPRGNHPGEKAAIQAALPGRSASLPPPTNYHDNNDDPTSLGRFSIERGVATPDLAEVSLDLSLSGFVYRYDRVLDVPLEETVATASHGDITYRVRRCATKRGEPAAELAISMPLSFTQSTRAAVQFFGRANPPVECFLHFPESGVNLPLEMRAYSGTPLLSGAVIQRFVFGWEGESFERLKLNPNSARVIVLKPVVVAKIERAMASAPVRLADEKQRWIDYSITHNYSMEASLYLSRHLPFRPDPLTCTREEFGRWLRIPALIHWPASLLPRDIADYAPRFNDILAKVASSDKVASAIALGTPESQRGEEIEAIATIYNPNFLISAINERGWRNEAAEQIKARFARGDINRSALKVVMALEDPATYPTLIKRLIQAPSVEYYDALRRLPGIQGDLDAAIAKAFAEASHGEVLAKANDRDVSAPYGPYLLPARQGDAKALELMFDVARNSKSYSKVYPVRPLIAATQEAVSSDEQWVAYLETRSAKDFRYDPLSRMWIPLPR